MPPSRRTALGAIATVTTVSVAGCTSIVGSRDDATASPTQSGTDGSFVARLDGPGTNRLLFDGSDVDSVGAVEESRSGGYQLPVELTASGTSHVTEVFRTEGVAEDPDAFEVVQRYDGEVVGQFEVAPGLADAIVNDEWDGELRVVMAERERAESIRTELSETATP